MVYVDTPGSTVCVDDARLWEIGEQGSPRGEAVYQRPIDFNSQIQGSSTVWLPRHACAKQGRNVCVWWVQSALSLGGGR